MAARFAVVRHDIPGAMAAIILEVAADFRIPAASVLAGTNVVESSLADPETRIAMHVYSRMLENCLNDFGEPAFALYLGSRISVAALGPLGYALMCCRNIQELVEVLSRYHRLISGSFHISVASDRDTLSIRMLGGMLEPTVDPMDCEIFFAAAAASLRQLSALSDSALSVTLAYPDPGYGALYRKLICPTIRFDAAESRLSIDRRYLDIPLQFANPTLLKLYRQQCDQVLASVQRSAEFTADVRRFLLGSPGRFPGFEEAAQHLLVSPRTLRRRLEEEGTTYQQVVHDLRRQLAETHLRDSLLSISEIAHMLGYSDISNFRRAFISWSGISPAEYRQNMRTR